MWLEQILTPDAVFTTDACLTGIGGMCGEQYFHKEVPDFILEIFGLLVAHLELIAVVVELNYGHLD